MKLGILVNTDDHLDEVAGLTKAALSKGHEVSIFTMDVGTKLLENPAFTALCRLDGVKMAYCDLSAKNVSAKTDSVPKEIKSGDQYNNAMMQSESDKVIIL